MNFERIIRFVDETSQMRYGNLEEEPATNQIEGSIVEILQGNLERGFFKTSEKQRIEKVRTRP